MKNTRRVKGSSGLGLLLVLAAAAALVIGGAFALYQFKGKKINTEDIASAEKIAGLRFTHKERKMMLGDLRENAGSYAKIREIKIDNRVPPAVHFDPAVPEKRKTLADLFGSPDDKKAAAKTGAVPGNENGSDPKDPLSLGGRESRESVKNNTPAPLSAEDWAVDRPVDLEDLAFAPVITLAQLIRSRKVTSFELTQMYLTRFRKYGPRLECVVTLTEDLALAQAARADKEIAAGRY
ncbi:MAG: hypothetical protein WBC70_18735, partial [Candidatus Aminicenantales bacterium]